MSQSDYLQYKRTQRILKEQAKLPKVLAQRVYTDAEQYAIETTVPNTKLQHSRLIPAGKQPVFDTDRKMTNCPTFILCKNTQSRPNRVLNTASEPAPTFRLNKNYQPETCEYQVNPYVTRMCGCGSSGGSGRHVCKCGTRVCEGTVVVPG